MANKLYSEESVQGIANAIRAVSGSTSTYTIGEMPAAISSISTGLDWSELNYDTTGENKGTPVEVISGFNYAKDIMNTYNANSSYYRDKKLMFFPNIDVTGRYDYGSIFNQSALIHCPPLTLGNIEISGTITCTRMFQETYVEEIVLNSINDNTTPGACSNTFQSCLNLKKVRINFPVLNGEYMFENCSKLTDINNFDLTQLTNYYPTAMFKNCSSLVNAPAFDTSEVKGFSDFFNNCTHLENVPLYDSSNVVTFNNMFNNCSSLNNDSLNNIIKMCSNATSYTGTKTLRVLGISSSYDTIIPTLSNYNDFITAGWTIS